MNGAVHELDAAIRKVPDMGGAYVGVPWDAEVPSGRRRPLGSPARMGAPGRILGKRKALRAQPGKRWHRPRDGAGTGIRVRQAAAGISAAALFCYAKHSKTLRCAISPPL